MSTPIAFRETHSEDLAIQEMVAQYRMRRAKKEGVLWRPTSIRFLERFPNTVTTNHEGLRGRVRKRAGLSHGHPRSDRKLKGTNANTEVVIVEHANPEPIEGAPDSATAAKNGQGLIMRMKDLESRCGVFAERIDRLSQILEGTKTDPASTAR